MGRKEFLRMHCGPCRFPFPTAALFPLLQLATVEYTQDWPLIWRRDRNPTLTVQSDLIANVLPATVVDTLRTKVEALNAELPVGYKIVPGGSVEEGAKSTSSVAAVVPAALLIMLVMLMIQLQSFSRLFLVLSVAPFGLIGVVARIAYYWQAARLCCHPGCSCPRWHDRSQFGDPGGPDRYGDRARARPVDAVIEATLHRFRPILLTAAAAILGMIPIAPTVFWGPMAYSIMGGLAVATMLTLVFLPALLCCLFRIKEPSLREVDRHRSFSPLPQTS